MDARNLPAPAVTAKADRAILAWSALSLLLLLLLPWSRGGRDVFVFEASRTGAALIGSSLPLALAGACFAGASVLALLPVAHRTRGLGAVLLAGAAALAITAELALRGEAFGVGAVVTFLAALAVAGQGISQAGILRADPFVATAFLWCIAFVLIFILVPLGAVLQAAFWVQGRLTATAFWAALSSPVFVLVDNPTTPYSEPLLALRRAALPAAAVFGYIVWRARSLPARGVLRGALAAVGVLALSVLYHAFGAFRNSVILAVVVGVISTVLGFAFALLEQRSRLPIKRLLGPLSILPVITPPFVLGLALIYLFGRQGFVTKEIFGLQTSALFGLLGVGVAQVLAFTPVCYLILAGVVQSLDPILEEASETLRADRWHTFRHVIWPLSRPGLSNAILLTMIESLADFGNPFLLGGDKNFLATEVFYAVTGRYNPTEAASFGVVLVAMSLSIFFLQRWWLGGRSYVTVTGKPSGARPAPLPRAIDGTLAAVFLLWAILIVWLYASVFWGSLVKLWGFDNTFTWQNYQQLSPTGWKVFWETTRLSAIAAIPSVALGFLIGYLVTRYQFRGVGALEFTSMLSFAIPGTVMGIGYILAFNRGPLYLTGTDVILVLAFVFRNMPVALRGAIAAISQVDRALEEASTTLRASTPTTLRRVVIPLVRAALLAGFVFAFQRSMTAVSQVIFLISPQHNLATAQILTWIQYGSISRGAALACVLIVAMMVVFVALFALTRKLDPGREVRM